MEPQFFPSPLDFRNWLAHNHQTKNELIVGFYKVASGKKSITWPQSVDEALCFGWIDGIRRSIDAESYSIRFTPRRPSSNWSAVNIAKVKKLMKEGKMKPAGLEIFHQRKKEQPETMDFASQRKDFSTYFEGTFQTHENAWLFFIKQAPSYQKTAIQWIMSAKQEKTKRVRLEKLIAASEQSQRIY